MATFTMPLAHGSKAPKFSTDPLGFDHFFADVDALAKKANLTTEETIAWAIRYAGAAGTAWQCIPCMLDSNNKPTFDVFREGVRACYMHLTSRRYTKRDLKALVSRTSSSREMSRDDFSQYYRDFLEISTYLLQKVRFAEEQRSEAYLEGFPPAIRERIKQRLDFKFPDNVEDDEYGFADIHAAATHVFSSRVSNSSVSAASPVKAEPVEQTSVDNLVQALTRVFNTSMNQPAPPPPPPPTRFPRPANAQFTPGGVNQMPPRWNQPSANQYQQNCIFCSAQDHFVRSCPVANQYLQQAKVIRNDYGKLTFPDGSYPGRNLPGKNIRERVDSYWASQGITSENRETVAMNFLEGPEECVFALDIAPNHYPPAPSSSTIPSDSSDAFDEVQTIQAQIDSLREAQVLALQKGKKEKFDGVEIMRRTGPPRNGAAIPPPPSRPSVNVREPSSQNPTQPSQKIGKPGARASDRPPQRPQGPMRPIAFPPKPPADDPKFRYQAPVETGTRTTELADRALDAKITISTRELLAASPDVRRHVKDAVTNKKISANTVEVDEVDTFLTSCFNFDDDEPDREPTAAYLDLVKYDQSRAAASLPLRVIFPSFGNGIEPECILDGGAQVVVMRRDIWEQLRTPIVANKAMPMESANASTSMTLGLIENHPVQLGPITIYLQIQVVDNAPFEVLLGRPFFDVVNCEEISRAGGSHEIRIRDPKDDNVYVLPTSPRIRKTPRAQPSDSSAAVNFHQ